MTPRFIRFAIVGCLGFMVDVTMMWLTLALLPAPLARGGAFMMAATTTWLGNRCFTFRERIGVPLSQQWLKAITSSLLGFIPNWGCYCLILIALPSPPAAFEAWLDAEHWRLLVIVPGVLLGMLVNYLLSSWWVFRVAPAGK